MKTGWVNIDFIDLPGVFKYDVRYGLPFQDGSCSYVFHEHVLEHLEYAEGIFFLNESFRALRPGGTLRVVLPDFQSILVAYARRDTGYFDLLKDLRLVDGMKPGDKTLIDFISYSVYQYGEHKSLWDEEKLTVLLKKAGFSSVARSSFKPETDSDYPARMRYSLYMEAAK